MCVIVCVYCVWYCTVLYIIGVIAITGMDCMDWYCCMCIADNVSGDQQNGLYDQGM